jgi:hypothetical protein
MTSPENPAAVTDHGTWVREISGKKVERRADTASDAVRYQFEGWARKPAPKKKAAAAAAADDATDTAGDDAGEDSARRTAAKKAAATPAR